MSNRFKVGILFAVGLMCLMTIAVYAADADFAGKWKGEAKATPPPAGGAPGGGLGGAPDGAAPASGAAPAGGGGGRTSGGGFGGGGGGRTGGGAGGFGSGFGGGAQKVQMNLKVAKDGKVSGNITFGSENALDVKEGKLEGGHLTFSAGLSGQPIYAYSGEMKGEELILTRIPPAGAGGGRVTEFVLSKNKK